MPLAYHKQIDFIIDSHQQKKSIRLSFNKMINAGFSGRNQASVRAHILELEKEGIPGPKTTPVFFSLTCENLKFGKALQVIGDKTSGEVEFVIITQGEKNYIGIGSDHTDRELEQHSMYKAKEICSNIMSDTIWDYDDIKDHWDKIEISSSTREQINGKDILYQRETLSSILHPNEIKKIIEQKLTDKNLDQSIIFSGTIPVLTNHPIYGKYFCCKLHDPILNRTLTCDYTIESVCYIS